MSVITEELNGKLLGIASALTVGHVKSLGMRNCKELMDIFKNHKGGKASFQFLLIRKSDFSIFAR